MPPPQPIDKLRKLLNLALDPAAHQGEIDNAAVKFIRECRKFAVTPDYLLGPKPARAKKEKKAEKPDKPSEMRFRFGKYRDLPIDQVDTGYIEWVLGTLDSIAPAFRRFLEGELEKRHGEFNRRPHPGNPY